MADLVQKMKPQDVDDILDEIEQNEKIARKIYSAPNADKHIPLLQIK